MPDDLCKHDLIPESCVICKRGLRTVRPLSRCKADRHSACRYEHCWRLPMTAPLIKPGEWIIATSLGWMHATCAERWESYMD